MKGFQIRTPVSNHSWIQPADIAWFSLFAILFASATVFAQEIDTSPDPATPASVPAASEPDPEAVSRAALIDQINQELVALNRRMTVQELIAERSRIAEQIGQLMKSAPDDPAVNKLVTTRWINLKILSRFATGPGESPSKKMNQLTEEVKQVYATTSDMELKSEAGLYLVAMRMEGPLDGPAAASIVEAYAREWPGNIRSANLMSWLIRDLNLFRNVRLAIAALLTFVAFSVWFFSLKQLEPIRRRLQWLRWSPYFLIVIAMAVTVMIVSDPTLMNSKWLQPSPQIIRVVMLIAMSWEYAIAFVGSLRFALMAVLSAIGTAIGLALIRKRINPDQMSGSWLLRSFVLFTAIMDVGLVLDAYLIVRKKAELNRRLVEEFPDSPAGRMAVGRIHQQESIGKPFELDFTDAITGRAVSMQSLRGQVVVVDFWATWCGPCRAEIPEMKRLYAEYHDKGVEFIGVSQDAPEKEGGLENLMTCVSKEQIPWPQYYQGYETPPDQSESSKVDFSQLWGVGEIPTVFIIDQEGKLYSTQARGRLDVLIPKLLQKSKANK